MRVLITGGAGQLAGDLERAFEASATAIERLGHDALDVTDDQAVERAFADTDPDVVLNCAAFHNVEVCETEEEQSAEVNVRAVKRLAQATNERGARLVHFSTNYVFDGRAAEPYTEDDRPNPESVYAITKLAGEYAALAYGADALVVRTSGLYGLAGSASKGGNFVQRMAAKAGAGEQITMVADQRLTPTFTEDLAASVQTAVAAGATGLMHLTNSGDCSWHEFTEAILECIGVDAEVIAAETQIKPGGAARPLNGVLAMKRLEPLGLPSPRHWREALADYVERAGVGG